MKFQLMFAAAFAALVSAGSAHAAVMVVGDGPERSCYLAAKFNQMGQEGLRHCNDALINSNMVLRDRAATFVNRGVILHAMNRIEAAMSDFNACLRIMPDQPDAYLNRGVGYISLKQYATALVDIEKGISLHPSDMAVAYYDRGVALEQLGRLVDAYKDYQRAATEDAAFVPAREAVSRFRVILRNPSAT